MVPNISSHTTIGELLERYPQLIHLFMEMELMCVGCPAEGFHTIEDVSREYHLDLDRLLENISKVVRDDRVLSGLSPDKAIIGHWYEKQ